MWESEKTSFSFLVSCVNQYYIQVRVIDKDDKYKTLLILNASLFIKKSKEIASDKNVFVFQMHSLGSFLAIVLYMI